MNLIKNIQTSISILLTGLIITSTANAEIFNTSMQTDYDLEQMRNVINNERAKIDLEPLEFSGKLQYGALIKALDMQQHSYFAHYRPSDNSMGIKDLADMVKFKHLYLGETLALNYASETAVIEGFMNSPAHREILMSPRAKYIGIDYTNLYYNSEPGNAVVVLVGDTYSSASLSESQESEFYNLTEQRNDITDNYYNDNSVANEVTQGVATNNYAEIINETLKISDGVLEFDFLTASDDSKIYLFVAGVNNPPEATGSNFAYKVVTLVNDGSLAKKLSDIRLDGYNEYYVSLVTVSDDSSQYWTQFEVISN